MENLNVKSRTKHVNHDAKKTRKKGMVPGVLYGKGIQNLLFEIGELELNDVIHREGEHALLNVEIDGNSVNTLIKEVQRDPVTRKVLHVDLEKIEKNKKIVSSVPIHYIGEEYAQKNGSILQKDKDSIKVQCEPENLPKFIDVDVSHANVGDVFRVADVEFGSEIAILDNLDMVLASVSYEQKIPEAVNMENSTVENKSAEGK